MRSLNLAVFTASLVLIAEIVALAPWCFEFGGYIHHALVHVGTVVCSITAITSARYLLKH